MPRKVVIFGTASFAEVADYYLTQDAGDQVVAFTATGESGQIGNYLGRPVVPFDEIERRFPPDDHALFVAVGYAKLNRVREQFVNEARGKGYSLISYICSKATRWPDLKIGANCFVFEDNTIQPFVSIGDNTVLWSGNHIGHHSTIGPHCFITSHVVISGHCRVGSHCFIGVNATIGENTSIGDRNLIGPATLIQKDTEPDEAYIGERTEKYPKSSSRFFR